METHNVSVTLRRLDGHICLLQANSWSLVREIRQHCLHPDTSILMLRGRTHRNQPKVMHTGPLAQWVSGDWGGLGIDETRGALGTVSEGWPVRQLTIRWQEVIVWRGPVPTFCWEHDPRFRSQLWEQVRWGEGRHLPDADMIQWGPLGDGGIVDAISDFVSQRTHPYRPHGKSRLIDALLFTPETMSQIAEVCPGCKLCWLDEGECAGGAIVYVRSDDTEVRREILCGWSRVVRQRAAARAMGEQGMSARRVRGYNPSQHVHEMVTARQGHQRTVIDPSILRDVMNWIQLEGATPTRESVARAMRSLQTYYPGRYNMWYRDDQRIAAILQVHWGELPEFFMDPQFVQPEWRHPGWDPTHQTLPGNMQRALDDLMTRAFDAFLRCPLRKARKNFLRADFNCYIGLGLCARAFQNPDFLEYRGMFGAPEGGPPKLKDQSRTAEYIEIWRWIAEDCGWGELVL